MTNTTKTRCIACSKTVKILKDGTLASHGWSEKRRGGRSNTVQLTPACAASGTLATFDRAQLATWLAVEPMLTSLGWIARGAFAATPSIAPFASAAHVAHNHATAARLRK